MPLTGAAGKPCSAIQGVSMGGRRDYAGAQALHAGDEEGKAGERKGQERGEREIQSASKCQQSGGTGEKGNCPTFGRDNASGGPEGSPEGIFYTLPYLGLQDLLAVERVSKSLRDAVKGDVLLWQRLHVDAPLNKKLTNEALIKLAGRAQGRLLCLSLVECAKITDEGIERVLVTNPMLRKLCLPGCTRISAEGIVRMVKAHTGDRVATMPGLQQLRIRGLYGVTREILDTLQLMLQPEGLGQPHQKDSRKPQFYRNGHHSFSCDEERAIDIEACPKCGNARVVYDCTRDRCQQWQGMVLQQCRGCFLCIARCEECGTCINESEEFEETFCLDFLCSACWQRLPKCSLCNRPGCGRHARSFEGS